MRCELAKYGLCVLSVVVAAEAWLVCHAAGVAPVWATCPKCKLPHADLGEHARHKRVQHVCISCGEKFDVSGAGVVCNPLSRLKLAVANGKIGLVRDGGQV